MLFTSPLPASLSPLPPASGEDAVAAGDIATLFSRGLLKPFSPSSSTAGFLLFLPPFAEMDEMIIAVASSTLVLLLAFLLLVGVVRNGDDAMEGDKRGRGGEASLSSNAASFDPSSAKSDMPPLSTPPAPPPLSSPLTLPLLRTGLDPRLPLAVADDVVSIADGRGGENPACRDELWWLLDRCRRLLIPFLLPLLFFLDSFVEEGTGMGAGKCSEGVEGVVGVGLWFIFPALGVLGIVVFVWDAS